MNENIFWFFNGFLFQYEWLDQSVLFTAEYLGWVLLTGLLAFIFTHKHGKIEGFKNILVILSAALFAWVISKMIKYLFFAPRPFEMLDNVNLLFEHGNNDSFPSGHATFFSAIAVAVFFYHRWIGALYILGALLIGIARVMAGIHFPVDILAGYAIGGVIGYFAYKFYHLKRV